MNNILILEEQIEVTESWIEVDLPPFTGNHGDPCFDEEQALIKVEKINGPIFLLSATRDEIAPTTPMCEKMMSRLKEKGFKHHYEHLAVEGGHAEPLKYFERVFAFLDKHFKREK